MIKRYYFENYALDTTIDLAYIDGIIPIDNKKFELELDEEDPIPIDPKDKNRNEKKKRTSWRYILNAKVNQIFNYKLKNIIESSIMDSKYGTYIESVDIIDNNIKIIFKDMVKINLKEGKNDYNL